VTIQTYLFLLCPLIRWARSRPPRSCLVLFVYQMHLYRRTNTNCHNNKTRINDNNNTVILEKKGNNYKLTFVVFIGSLFFVLILGVVALHGIQQLVVNFAFPVVILSSWFLVLIFVDIIKNIGNINKGSIDIFLFESRFVEKKNSLIGDNKTVYNEIVILFYCNLMENLPPRSG